MSEGKAPAGDLLDRCSLAVLSPGKGVLLGTAVLVGPRHALTCQHVVNNLKEVGLADGPDEDPFVTASVVKNGEAEGPDDLAMLELKKPVWDRGVIRFAPGQRGDVWHAVGFPDLDGDASQREHADGTLQGVGPEHDWLAIDAKSHVAIAPGFSGGAVWVRERGVAVGVVTRYRDRGVGYIIPAKRVLAFWPELNKKKDSNGIDTLLSAGVRSIPNIGRDRFVQIYSEDGSLVGHGLWFHGTSVLTATDLIQDGDARSVHVLGHGRLPASSVRDAKDRVLEVAPGIGLLQIRGALVHDQTPCASDAEDLEGRTWTALLPVPANGEVAAAKARSSSQDQTILTRVTGSIRGRVTDTQRWQLDLAASSQLKGLQDIPVLGLPVFLFDRQARGCHFLGVVTGQINGASIGFEMSRVSDLEKLCSLVEPPAELAPEVYRRNRRRTMRFLKKLEHHSDAWEELLHIFGAEDDPVGLADRLIERIGTLELAEGCAVAHYRFIEEFEDDGAAEAIYQVLMSSLPASLRRRGGLVLPDRMANEIWADSKLEIFIELMIAASRDGVASFRRDGSVRDGDNKPVAESRLLLHEYELGIDVGGRDRERESVSQLWGAMAAHMGATGGFQQKLASFLEFLALRKDIAGLNPLIPESLTRDVAHASEDEIRERFLQILDLMNREIESESPIGRTLYVLKTARLDEVLGALAPHIPALPIVESQDRAMTNEDIQICKRVGEILLRRSGQRREVTA